MLASQHGTTTADTYTASRIKCRDYVERDATTGETYSDWRMPTQAEIYLIDVLQNIRICEVKGILEEIIIGVRMLPVLLTSWTLALEKRGKFSPLNASVRCVRDIR